MRGTDLVCRTNITDWVSSHCRTGNNIMLSPTSYEEQYPRGVCTFSGSGTSIIISSFRWQERSHRVGVHPVCFWKQCHSLLGFTIHITGGVYTPCYIGWSLILFQPVSLEQYPIGVVYLFNIGSNTIFFPGYKKQYHRRGVHPLQCW